MQRICTRGFVLNRAHLSVTIAGAATSRTPLPSTASTTTLCAPGNDCIKVHFARCLHVCPPAAAGHNKWSKIKRAKAAADQSRSKVYAKLSVEISSSIRHAGDNPDTNFRLSSALSRARKMGMPKQTVENAIATGKGAVKGELVENVLYEGRGPAGYCLLIETLTVNKKRTRPEIRTLLLKHGGLLGEPGSSAFMFEHKGVVSVSRENIPDESDPMELAIEVGAEEVKYEVDEEGEQCYWFTCDSQQLKKVTDALKSAGLSVSSSTLEYLPKSTVALNDVAYHKALSLIDLIKDHQDVIRVYDNIVPE